MIWFPDFYKKNSIFSLNHFSLPESVINLSGMNRLILLIVLTNS